jgi:hypothetical protein
MRLRDSAVSTSGVQRASPEHPGELRRFHHGSGALLQVGTVTIRWAVLKPGWRWSTDLKPLVGTQTCQLHHLHIPLAGRFAIQMGDGSQHELGPNDVMDIPPGHDA